MSGTGRAPLVIGDELIITPHDGIDAKTGQPVIIVDVYDRKNVTNERAVFRTQQEYDEFVQRCLNPPP